MGKIHQQPMTKQNSSSFSFSYLYLLGWLYASHVFLPHNRSTVWRPRRLWSFPRQVDADCEAEHRPCEGRECLALVAGPCLWLPHLHQGDGAIPPDQANLASSFHPSQGTAFLLLLKTIPGF